MSVREVFDKLGKFPSLGMGYPTPMEELPQFRAALGSNAPRILIKRDDYTGPGFGGNKVRKLDYFLAQAMADNCEVVVTVGGIKSNHCRATAAFCAKLGLRCILVLNAASLPSTKPASLFVDELYGAEIHFVSSREERSQTMQSIAAQLRKEGINVCEVPLGASTPLGALGYVDAVFSIRTAEPDYIFHSSSSGGTQAGILAGSQLFGLQQTKIIGVSPDDPADSIAQNVTQIYHGIGELLGVDLPKIPVTVLDDYVGNGYGISSPESDAAIRLLARTEGILLDPTYSAKAIAALMDWIRVGKFSADETVLFWHTGGQLALFNSFEPFSSPASSLA